MAKDMTEEEAMAILGSPIVTEPVVLDDAALKPMTIPSLEDRLKEANANGGNTPPRRRSPGRPKGSVKKPPAGRGATIDTTASEKKDDDTPGMDPAEKKALKDARAAQLAQATLDAINDNFFMILMSMGVPDQLLYQPGQAPVQVKAESNKYTALGATMAVNPAMAKNIGHFLAELEQTDIGQKVTGATGGGNGPIIVYGLLSLFSTVQYVQGLSRTYKELAPLLQAYRAQQMQDEAKKQRSEAPKPPPADIYQQQPTGGVNDASTRAV